MPKMKTKSGAKKRFKTTGSGKIKAKSAFTRHMQMNKSKKMKRKARGLFVLTKADAEKARGWLPYAGKKSKKSGSKSSEGGK